MKTYLKTIIREGRGKFGIGLEMFRLDADEIELTELEQEALDETESEAANTAIIRVYEDIGEDFWTGGGMSVKKFADALDDLGVIKNLNIHINSLGGDTHSAQAIYNLISDYEAQTTSFIDGIAASAATIVASGADHVVMRKNANYMIHNAWTIAMGNAADLRQAAEALDKVTEPIIGVYKAQTGNKVSRDKIVELMDAETWMTADEALEYGFVNEVRGKAATIKSTAKGRMLVNGQIFNAARYGFKNMPKYPKVMPNEEPAPAPPAPTPDVKSKEKDNKPEGKKRMTLEELQQVDPDLVASIRADAGKAEQTRLAQLNAMMAPGLEAIIAKAIEEGTQPASIAMECFNVVRENNESTARVNSLKRDAAPANNVPAGDAPIVKPKATDNKKAKASTLIAEAFKNDSRQKAREKSNGRMMFSN